MSFRRWSCACAVLAGAALVAVAVTPISIAAPEHHGRTCFGKRPTIRVTGGERTAHHIEGTNGDDVIISGPDSLDSVDAKGGDDLICTGGIRAKRSDNLGADVERINGGPGNDKVLQRSGDSEIAGGPGRDVMIGGADEDAFAPDGTYDAHGRVKGGPDHAEDVIKGGTDGSVLRGDEGDFLGTNASKVDLRAELASGNGVGPEHLRGIEQVSATGLIIGDKKDNILFSGARMEGGGGCDVIMAYSNPAVIFGDEGDDYLVGGLQGDDLHGGEGDDFIDGYEFGTGTDVADCGPGQDFYRDVEVTLNCETEFPNGAAYCG